MKRKVVAFTALLVVLAMALPASAHTASRYRLRRIVSGDAAVRWERGTVDSPLDSNHARLRLEVDVQSGDDYVNMRERGSGVRRLITEVRNLSFDFRSLSYVGAGSPRLSIEVDTNGDRVTDVIAFLAAFHCNTPIGGSVWHRADFTGQVAPGCTIFADGTYSSDGVQSAWDAFVDAHSPSSRVLDAYVVMDEVGVSHIDRVALHNHMFTRPPRNGNAFIVHCPTEASC